MAPEPDVALSGDAHRIRPSRVLQGVLLVVIGLAALVAGLVAADSLGLIAGAIGILVVVVGGLQLLPGPARPGEAKAGSTSGARSLEAAAAGRRSPSGGSTDLKPYWRYEVRVGDTLWDIAARQLGDPLRWVEIAELNYGRVQRDGRVFDDVRRLVAGWVLQLPEPTPGWTPEGLVEEAEGERGAVVRPFLPDLFGSGEEDLGSVPPPSVSSGVAPAERDMGEAMARWAAELSGVGEIWPDVPPVEARVTEPSLAEVSAVEEVSTAEAEDAEAEARRPDVVAEAMPTVIESWALWASHKPWATDDQDVGESHAEPEQASEPGVPSSGASMPLGLRASEPERPSPEELPGSLRRRAGIRRLGLRRPEPSAPEQGVGVDARGEEAVLSGDEASAQPDQLVRWAAEEEERRRRAIDDVGRRARSSAGAGVGDPVVAMPPLGARTGSEPADGGAPSRRARLFRRRRTLGGEVPPTPVGQGVSDEGPWTEAGRDELGSASPEVVDEQRARPPVPVLPVEPPVVPPLPEMREPSSALGPIEIFRHRTRLPDVDETLRQTNQDPHPEPEPELELEPEPELELELEPPGQALAGRLDVERASVPDDEPVAVVARVPGGLGPLTPILPGEVVSDVGGAEEAAGSIEASEPEPVELLPVDQHVVDRLINACHSWRSEWLSLAMRAAGRLAPEAFDAVIGAFVGEDETLLVLAKPTPAPAPIFEEAGELAWRLSTEITLDDLGEQAADLPSPCPTLVPLGWEVDDDDVPGPLVLLALGAVRSLALGVPWARSLIEAVVTLGDVRFSAPWSDGRLRFAAEDEAMPLAEASEELHVVVLGEPGGLESADRRLGERRGTVVVAGEEPGAVLQVGAEGRVPMLRCRVGLDRRRTIPFGAEVTGVGGELASGGRDRLEVEIDVLGPIEIRSASVDRELIARNPQLRALLAALALRPDESFERLVRALWRARIPGRTERGKVIQLLQRALGEERRDAVVERVGRVYRIAFAVRSDLLECLDDQGHLRPAVLEKIRGPVLEGAELVDVALGEGTVEALRAEVRRLAIDAAVEARRTGDLHKAYRALERGVLASPKNEQIWVELLCCASLLSDSHLARASAALVREWGVASIDDLPGSLPGLVRTLTP